MVGARARHLRPAGAGSACWSGASSPAVAAALIGLAVLRLKGHYFAIATLGVGIAVRELVNNLDCVGLPGSETPLFCLGGGQRHHPAARCAGPTCRPPTWPSTSPRWR